jgi:hypothetical protein
MSGAGFAPAAVFGENKELQAAQEFAKPSAGALFSRLVCVFASKGLGE